MILLTCIRVGHPRSRADATAHARGAKISITLLRNDQGVELSVADDGPGKADEGAQPGMGCCRWNTEPGQWERSWSSRAVSTEPGPLHRAGPCRPSSAEAPRHRKARILGVLIRVAALAALARWLITRARADPAAKIRKRDQLVNVLTNSVFVW